MKLFDLEKDSIFTLNGNTFRVVGWKHITKAHKKAPSYVFEVTDIKTDEVSWFIRNWDVNLPIKESK